MELFKFDNLTKLDNVQKRKTEEAEDLKIVQLMVFLTVLSVVCMVAGLLYYLWRRTKRFQAQKYQLCDPPAPVGPLAPNSLLSNPELLLKGRLKGPESILIDGDNMYTGTSDGRVVKIVDGKIVSCYNLRDDKGKRGTWSSEPKFGRPMGIRKLNDDCLLVVDAYTGVYRLDLKKGAVTKLVSCTNKCYKTDKSGRMTISPLIYLNDIDILDENTFFVSNSSVGFTLRQRTNVLLENAPTGKIVQVKTWSGETNVVLDKLFYPYGLQIHPDRQSLLYAEAAKCRVMRYYFAGEKKGQVEAFAANLPGVPTNIRLSSDGRSLFLGTIYARFRDQPAPIDVLSPRPNLRRLLVTFFPDKVMPTIAKILRPKPSIVVELDLQGNIVRSYQDCKGILKAITHVSDDGKYLYLGSIDNKFIGRVRRIV